MLSKWLQLRRNLLILALYAILVVIVTYPLTFQFREIIPMLNMDTYSAMWQNWWMGEAFTHGLDIHSTHYLFAPQGLDTTLQPRRWVTFPIWFILYHIFGEPGAYNLTVLLQTLVRAFAMYHFARHFSRYRLSAFMAGILFAFSPKIVFLGLAQPNTGSIEFIPIFMIIWVNVLRRIVNDTQENSLSILNLFVLMLLSGIIFSANIYQNIKIGILAMFMGGGYALWIFIIHQLWKKYKFWLGIVIFAIFVGVISSPILVPALKSNDLNDAINQYTPTTGVDLPLFFQIQPDASLFDNQLQATLEGKPQIKAPSGWYAFMSVISLFVAGIGVIQIIRHYREQMVWIFLTVLFFLLSLGVIITINGEPIDIYWTPYRLVLDNPIMRLLREPSRFQILMIFTLSMITVYGFDSILQRINKQIVQCLTISIFLALILIETSVFPIIARPAKLLPAYTYLINQGQPGALIEIPLHRQASKLYMYSQIFHKRPIVEGMTARTPSSAYDYIRSNPLLANVLELAEFNQLSQDMIDNWTSIIQQLINDGFQYLVVHFDTNTGIYRIQMPKGIANLFLKNAIPVFEQDGIAIYDLYELRDVELSTND